MDDIQGGAIVRQALEQAAGGTLPVDVFSLLLGKLVEAANYTIAAMLYRAWRDNLRPDVSIPPDQQQVIAHLLGTLKAHLPDL